MIIKHFTDNDLYKFTTMYAVQKLYPFTKVKYKFINRAKTKFPEGFATALRSEINSMAALSLSQEEQKFIEEKCYFFDPVFIDFLRGYRYNPNEIKLSQKDGDLSIEIEGYWYRTVLWEVPLMALISELYFKMTEQSPNNIESNAKYKAEQLVDLEAKFADFGTRRRFSFDVHDKVIDVLIKKSGEYFTGTSNVYLAMKYDTTPIGTHPHEWFMYHAVNYGYRKANREALKAWTEVYNGALGIALTDTFTTENFFDNFDLQYAKLFDGLRWDSGDPIEFTKKALDFYNQKHIDARSKTIVYSDSLNIATIKKIKSFAQGRIMDAYGVGTYLTNDVGVKPLNMVIKLTHATAGKSEKYFPTVKLSDVEGKNTGTESEIEICKKVLNIK